jgi:uncharacterized protein (UPF0303 family)
VSDEDLNRTGCSPGDLYKQVHLTLDDSESESSEDFRAAGGGEPVKISTAKVIPAISTTKTS